MINLKFSTRTSKYSYVPYLGLPIAFEWGLLSCVVAENCQTNTVSEVYH